MKKYLSLIALTLIICLISACADDSKNVINEEWKAQNEAAIDSIAKTPGYEKIEAGSRNGNVYYKVLQSGDANGKKILFTDEVTVKYCGAFINGTVFDSTEGTLMNGTTGNAKTKFRVNGVIEGWAVALQHMRVGDKWHIWIPWNLAYGAGGNKSIPGFSALQFVVEVVAVKSDGIK